MLRHIRHVHGSVWSVKATHGSYCNVAVVAAAVR